MCDTCGCNVTESNRHLIEEDGKHAHTQDGSNAVEVLENLLSENDRQAAHNRHHFDSHGVLTINLMSSPGSGKTSLLEATVQALGGEYRIGVIEGDLETENDAERLRRLGIEAVQITTGTACHLDAHMVHNALHDLNLSRFDILFIENVGNLVCPASFDLGQHLNVALLSVTEGDDKPAKYPVLFRAADNIVISKADLLRYLDDFSPERAETAIRNLATEVPIITLSAKSGSGLDEWLDWLHSEANKQLERVVLGETLTPKIQLEGAKLHSHS
ncbi:hydrogenase nickel incorporation protein HypB [endosymbiont of Ridgeia piscesae]|jgi:hydrogenase nickel incorporation protein HypB|uniref:Hydrogenase maturation factor HypB n=1 Tax=endosymbiont of Ridgeia piscesae TaxID=54398 RepID=A0A0T5YXW5_9GAMM|nr:hydrogenase nickel incorporation protein HypB [endosymbiont of Ridgeia piscesae]KRT55418.1 Hydrogenase nickel incorporation protein HypB [endosymbiont of Ridgeia piscesae]KRT57454.1 Hydrogenase nickel incorporation protein HypB [endosymbiont of Ridgeia piscesae]